MHGMMEAHEKLSSNNGHVLSRSYLLSHLDLVGASRDIQALPFETNWPSSESVHRGDF